MSILFILLFVGSSISLALGAFDSEGADIADYIDVHVASGDSLWTIAKEVNHVHYAGEEDVRKIIFSIRKANNIDYDSVIRPGDVLTVPLS